LLQNRFHIFAKLFLMTGSIWVVRIVLLFLQLKDLYFTWYAVALEAVFSIPEGAFSITILLHPEFKKWAWNKSTLYSEEITIARISQYGNCFKITHFRIVFLQELLLSSYLA